MAKRAGAVVAIARFDIDFRPIQTLHNFTLPPSLANFH